MATGCAVSVSQGMHGPHIVPTVGFCSFHPGRAPILCLENSTELQQDPEVSYPASGASVMALRMRRRPGVGGSRYDLRGMQRRFHAPVGSVSLHAALLTARWRTACPKHSPPPAAANMCPALQALGPRRECPKDMAMPEFDQEELDALVGWLLEPETAGAACCALRAEPRPAQTFMQCHGTRSRQR